MNSLIQFKTTVVSLVITVLLSCFGLLSRAQAVNPPPDGGYPGGNTAEGDNALFNLSTEDGAFNTAVGWYSLFSNVTGSLNTALGAGALDLNTSHNNTAVGAAALLLNTTGDGNTATGAAALLQNTTGRGNTAVGAKALFSNIGGGQTDGVLNTAVGLEALTENTTGSFNTAVGAGLNGGELPAPAALGSNTTGSGNTAVGARSLGGPAALGSNTTGSGNTAVGQGALRSNTAGGSNTAIGAQALLHLGEGEPSPSPSPTPGDGNIAVGSFAGSDLISGSENIYIGNKGLAEESYTIRIGTAFQPSPTPAFGQNRTFIAGIYGSPPGANTLPVVCADDGKLTANASSRRFKHDIKAIDNTSEAILALKPVSFRYNNDSTDTPWFGLIAEDVAEVNPDLIARDKEGKPFGVRYDAVNAMLLNEFLKAHRRMEEQEATIAKQQKQIDALTAGLQKVSAQLEVSKPASQMVENNR